MIVSPRRRFVFVHIPKTGGTAFTLAYEARALAEDILIGDTPKARRRRRRLEGLSPAGGRLWKHSTLAEAGALLPAGPLEGWCIATLVRNPWDRVLSYHSWARAQRFDHPAVHLARALPFAEFLRHPDGLGPLAAHPYGSYLRRDGAEVPALFLRLEHLDADLPRLEARLGLRLGPLPRANASARPADYRAAYRPEDAALVAQACAADIARFGYAFG